MTLATPIATWPAAKPDGLDVQVVDAVFADIAGYRAEVLALPFQSVSDGAATFHGIAPGPAALGEWIAAHFPGCHPASSFVRQSPAGQIEPHFIHADLSMGDWSAVLYLTPDPPEGDGTTFWQRVDTGDIASRATTVETYCEDGAAWFEAALWTPIYRVPAHFNRLLLFASRLYHSRSLPENYGTGDQARLIQMVFGGY